MSQLVVTAEADTRWEIVLPGGVSMAFHLIPAGDFRMGQRGGHWLREEPQHRVVIVRDFWMGETPVTQAQLAAWKLDHENMFPNQPEHPAELVTWDEARDYCRWLTTHCASQFPAGDWRADLPDEARWEYACRAGTETEYYSGDGEAALMEVGWFDNNSEEKTHPVGLKPANAWGLQDMHGNVWEWCLDAWDPAAYRKRVDGWGARAWEGGEESPDRMLRGGSWRDSARFCRSAVCLMPRPSARDGCYGFRVCLARSSPAENRQQAESAPGGVARRDDEAKPDGGGGAGRSDIDLARERLPGEPRSSKGRRSRA